MTLANDNTLTGRELDDWSKRATVEDLEARLGNPPIDDDFDLPPWPSLAGMMAGGER